MTATSTEDIVNRTVAAIRASKNAELRMAANEHPEQVVGLEDVANLVDTTLQEVSQALTEALNTEDREEASEREQWWGRPEPGPYSHSKGQLTDEGYLPRTPTGSSWWTGNPEKP